MKIYIQVLFIIISFSAINQASAVSQQQSNIALDGDQKIIPLYSVINSASLRIRLDDNLHGVIESKNCSFCKTIKITIMPESSAYRNNVSVPLKQAKNRKGRFATINYNTRTNSVSAIRW